MMLIFFSHCSLKPQSEPQDGLDSQAKDEDEKKRSFMGLIRQLPHLSTMRRQSKDGSLGRESKAKQTEVRRCLVLFDRMSQ